MSIQRTTAVSVLAILVATAVVAVASTGALAGSSEAARADAGGTTLGENPDLAVGDSSPSARTTYTFTLGLENATLDGTEIDGVVVSALGTGVDFSGVTKQDVAFTDVTGRYHSWNASDVQSVRVLNGGERLQVIMTKDASMSMNDKERLEIRIEGVRNPSSSGRYEVHVDLLDAGLAFDSASANVAIGSADASGANTTATTGTTTAGTATSAAGETTANGTTGTAGTAATSETAGTTSASGMETTSTTTTAAGGTETAAAGETTETTVESGGSGGSPGFGIGVTLVAFVGAALLARRTTRR